MGPTWKWGLVAASYLIGSVLFAAMAAKRRGVDLASVGSGNPGATNASRALGQKAGRLIMAADMLKGFLPALGMRLWLGPDAILTAMVGFAAVFGHCYSVFYRFRGGKGAATGAGVLLAVWPYAGGAALVVFAISKRLTRKASVGSLLGLVTGLVVVGVEAVAYERGAWPGLMVGAISLLVLWRHRENMRRLWKKEERTA